MSIPVRVNLKRLEESVAALEAQPVKKDGILLYGDSLFTRWKAGYGHPDPRGSLSCPGLVNHGFGSSTAEEQLYYYPRLVRPYQPRVLVHVTFGNDRMFGYSPGEIMSLQTRLYDWARHDFPGIRIYALDAKIDVKNIGETGFRRISRDEYNALLRDYCGKHEDCTLLRTVDSPLFFKDPADVGDYDKVRTDIFVEDGIHFNAGGYELFGRFMKERLAPVL